MGLRLALLDATYGGATTVRNFRRALDGELTAYRVVDGEFPERDAHDAVVVTGSRASVYWDEPWIDTTREWIRDAIDGGTAALGICWGHQLLADALGGTVEPMDEYELGYRTVSHTGDELFDGVPEEFTVFTTHSDAVTELPDGAELTAQNDYGVHGFRRGDVWGVQAHPEYDRVTAERVVRGKDHLPRKRIEGVCDGITEEAYREASTARRVFENFCSLAATPEPAAADD